MPVSCCYRLSGLLILLLSPAALIWAAEEPHPATAASEPQLPNTAPGIRPIGPT